MNCLQVEENFSAHLEDALDYQTLRHFESHITECTSCQQNYALFQDTIKASQQLPQIEPSSNFLQELDLRLKEEQLEKISFWKHIQIIFTTPKWALTAVMAILLITATITFHDNWFDDDTQPSIDRAYPSNPVLSSESPAINNQFLPRRSGVSNFSNRIATQPMQQHYTLKRVSYSTVSTGGGL